MYSDYTSDIAAFLIKKGSTDPLKSNKNGIDQYRLGEIQLMCYYGDDQWCYFFSVRQIRNCL